MPKLRVLHLIGSAVSDFYCDLSRLYAQDCLENTANPALYEFHIAYITPDRQWHFPTSLSKQAIDLAPTQSLAEALQTIEKPQNRCDGTSDVLRARDDPVSRPI